jgi:AAA domain
VNPAEIAVALGKPQREGHGWRCLCPCHDDHDPSLSIVERNGKLLVTCRAGCDQAMVVDELKRRGLWMNGHASKLEIVAEYSYDDEDGRLLFQVCRLYPKTFRQRRPDGVGGWIWNTESVRRVPYRLPELIAAARKANGQAVRVYITEGEKDADRLKAKWGLLATTNPGGCGKWHSGYDRYFSGFDVIVIPDNDDAGRAHAQTVAANLRPTAATVRILELPDLPPKGDISDWLDRNPDAMQSDFEALIENAESFKPSNGHTKIEVHDAGDIDIAKIPPRRWLLGLTFCRKFLSGLIAEGGAGKTAIRYAQYLAVASGKKLTREHIHCRSRVMIVCLEDCLDEVRRRLGASMLHHGISPEEIKGWLFYCTPKGLKLLQTDLRGTRATGLLHSELKTSIAEHKIDLVGIDPFVKSHGVEENDNNAIDQVCTMLADIADEFDCAVDIISHARKGQSTPGDAERERGASAKKDAGRLMRTVTSMSKDEAEMFGLTDRESLVRVDDAKVNLTPRSPDAMWFRLVGVPIGNGTPEYPNGDNVQTVERWDPPDNFANVTDAIWNTIIDEIDLGLPNGRRYTNASHATDRAAWKVVVKHLDRTEKQARAIINTWVKNQVLLAEDYDDPLERKPLKGLKANPVKRPGQGVRY